MKPKPCPFCGGDDISTDGYIRDGSTVYCRKCGARTHAFEPNSRSKALEKWNIRFGVAKDVLIKAGESA